ncbi:MAG: hypothetical protein WAW80_04030 [Candidatus Saccharimonadales bacterium]
MADIDFEELDKAVNNLMGKVVPDTSNDVQKEKSFTINSTLEPGATPVYDKLDLAAKKIGNETLLGRDDYTTVEEIPVETVMLQTLPQSLDNDETQVFTPHSQPITPAVSRPNSGRFMDVVHPSSDMRTSVDTGSLVIPERTRSVIPPQPATAPSLDMPEPAVVSEPIPVPPPIQTDLAPLTPFLPDAKVDKRPLGDPNSALVGSVVKDDMVTDENTVDTTKTYSTREDNEIKTSFDNTLTQDRKQNDDTQKEFDPTSIGNSKVIEEKEILAIETADSITESSILSVESGDTESLSSAVASNKQEQPESKKDATTGDTYNANSDNKSPSSIVKRKSGWGIVVIVISIIVVCAVIGIVAYFLLVGV